ncbi:unnamed protein product [Pleuronectes platessa]|uniref:Uncharacterized protein n=1 Tax=Pleuronectes platessa TaxID=8262 RepID=A0A9N7UR60_PLEPL|nr:unnamed protein product [Pleuronectes platessa]
MASAQSSQVCGSIAPRTVRERHAGAQRFRGGASSSVTHAGSARSGRTVRLCREERERRERERGVREGERERSCSLLSSSDDSAGADGDGIWVGASGTIGSAKQAVTQYEDKMLYIMKDSHRSCQPSPLAVLREAVPAGAH